MRLTQARKALRALKALIRLQAIIRGHVVRRRLTDSFKFSPKAADKRTPNAGTSSVRYEKKQLVRPNRDLPQKEVKLGVGVPTWDYTMLTKEDMEAYFLSKQDAMTRRERMKQYPFCNKERRNVQITEQSVRNREHGNRIHWLEHKTDKDRSKGKEPEYVKPNAQKITDSNGRRQLTFRNMERQSMIEGLVSPLLFPRRSCSHGRWNAVGNDGFSPNSPVLPTYMAATESAKAKARSMSTPKQRLGFVDACYCRNSSPYKNKLSSWSSFND